MWAGGSTTSIDGGSTGLSVSSSRTLACSFCNGPGSSPSALLVNWSLRRTALATAWSTVPATNPLRTTRPSARRRSYDG